MAMANVALCSFLFGRKYVDHRVPNFTESRELYVYPNMDAMDILTELVDSGAVARPGSLKRAFKEEGLLPVEGASASVTPGHYTISTSSTSS